MQPRRESWIVFLIAAGLFLSMFALLGLLSERSKEAGRAKIKTSESQGASLLKAITSKTEVASPLAHDYSMDRVLAPLAEGSRVLVMNEGLSAITDAKVYALSKVTRALAPASVLSVAVTDAAGMARFGVPITKEAKYLLVVADGYARTSYNLQTNYNDKDGVRIILKSAARLTISSMYKNGAPAEGCTFTLSMADLGRDVEPDHLEAGCPERIARHCRLTDKHGSLCFEGLGPGEYYIYADSPEGIVVGPRRAVVAQASDSVISYDVLPVFGVAYSCTNKAKVLQAYLDAQEESLPPGAYPLELGRCSRETARRLSVDVENVLLIALPRGVDRQTGSQPKVLGSLHYYLERYGKVESPVTLAPYSEIKEVIQLEELALPELAADEVEATVTIDGESAMLPSALAGLRDAGLLLVKFGTDAKDPGFVFSIEPNVAFRAPAGDYYLTAKHPDAITAMGLKSVIHWPVKSDNRTLTLKPSKEIESRAVSLFMNGVPYVGPFGFEVIGAPKRMVRVLESSYAGQVIVWIPKNMAGSLRLAFKIGGLAPVSVCAGDSPSLSINFIVD